MSSYVAPVFESVGSGSGSGDGVLAVVSVRTATEGAEGALVCHAIRTVPAKGMLVPFARAYGIKKLNKCVYC